MGTSQPFMYNAQRHDDSRFPTTTFDPKAVTRASWEPKPKKARPKGPLVSFNRHPDAHMVLPYRTNQYAPLGSHTKSWIKWLRRFQLFLRVLQLSGAVGILVLFSLFTKVEGTTSWVIRILQAIAIVHCVYAIYHHSRDATGRTPASSAAYQFSAIILDVVAIAGYIFGVLTVHEKANNWGTLLNDQNLMEFFIPAVYYTLIGTGSLHPVSLSTSLWLGWIFRKISLMPPDMNPLEDHLTSRPFHKRNKSSISTASTAVDSERKLPTPSEARRDSMWLYQNASQPSTISFMHTRAQSRDSLNNNDTKLNLPNRQYQIIPGNSPRNSTTSPKTNHQPFPPSSQRGSYTGVPLTEPNLPQPDVPNSANEGRVAKFTEAWMPTGSLISRTNQRNRALAAAGRNHRAQGSKSYSALTQPYNLDEYSSDSEFEDENGSSDIVQDSGWSNTPHPNPLRSHPTSPAKDAARIERPRGVPDDLSDQDYGALFEISFNKRRVSAGRDIADEQRQPEDMVYPRQRDSSIQPENFYSRPYGDLRCATPPILVGSSRKVSSGNDYSSKYSSVAYERRNVSGKIAEEGRAGNRFLAGPIR